MKRHRPRFRKARFPWFDVLIVGALVAAGTLARTLWPDRVIADMAIPAAVLVLLALWRLR